MWPVYDKLKDIGVCWVKSDGAIMRCNPTFAGYFGYDRIHAEKLTIYQLTSMSDQKMTADSFTGINAGVVEEIHCVKKYQHPNGSVFEKTLHAIALPDGSLMSFVYDTKEDKDSQQKLLLELLRVISKPDRGDITVNVQGNDNSRTATADRGGIADAGDRIPNPTGGRELVVVVLVCAVLTLVLMLVKG